MPRQQNIITDKGKKYLISEGPCDECCFHAGKSILEGIPSVDCLIGNEHVGIYDTFPECDMDYMNNVIFKEMTDG